MNDDDGAVAFKHIPKLAEKGKERYNLPVRVRGSLPHFAHTKTLDKPTHFRKRIVSRVVFFQDLSRTS
jgi:hypothetical protein